MDWKRYLLVTIASCVVSCAVAQDESSAAQNVSGTSADLNEQIKSRVQAYVDAFNAGDVAKLGSFWSLEGVFVDEMTGEQIQGREAIEASFRELFSSQPGSKLACETIQISATSPNVVIEEGNAIVTRGDESSSQTRYRVVYVKRDNKWLIDRVTDNLPTDDSNQTPNPLSDLGWLVGTWLDQGDTATIELTCQWTRGEAFIMRRYSVMVADEVETSGVQFIGWDANTKKIRSWLFDENGTVVQGEWTQIADAWKIRSIATLADGAKGTSTTILTRIDDDSYSVEKVKRIVDGELMPNLPATIVQRR